MPYCTNLHYLLQSCAVLYILIFIYHLIFRSAEVLFATGIGSKGGAYSGWIWLQQSCNLPISKCEELTCRLLAIFDICVILKPTLTKKKWTQKRVGIWNHTHKWGQLDTFRGCITSKTRVSHGGRKAIFGRKVEDTWRVDGEGFSKAHRHIFDDRSMDFRAFLWHKLDFLDVLLLAGYFMYCIVRFLPFISCKGDYTTYGWWHVTVIYWKSQITYTPKTNMETHSHGLLLQMIFLFKRVNTSGSSHKFSGGVSYILHMEHTWIFQVCV